MRLFEVLLLLALSFSFLGFLVKPIRRPSWFILLTWIPVVLAVLHFLFEGQRWQMTPAYVLTVLPLLIIALHLLRNWKQGRKLKEQIAGQLRRVVIVRLAILSTLIVLATGALAAAVPVPELPEPTGPYAIGTTRFHFVDHSRPESFTPDTTDRRTLLVQAWYPAEFTKDFQRATWLPEAEAVFGAVPAYHGFPRFVGGHLALIKSHAYWEAPMSPSQPRYPIVVYSTGLFWASDARCKVGVNLDGKQFGDLGGKLLDKPFMWMHNERRRSMNEPIYSGSANPYYRVGINGTTHLDFGDPIATSYLTKLIGFSGPNGGARSMEIIDAYALAFFDRYLKGNEAPLLESASPFAEVDFRKTEFEKER